MKNHIKYLVKQVYIRSSFVNTSSNKYSSNGLKSDLSETNENGNVVHGNNNEIYGENNIVLGNGVKINKKIDRPYNMKTKTIIKEIYLY